MPSAAKNGVAAESVPQLVPLVVIDDEAWVLWLSGSWTRSAELGENEKLGVGNRCDSPSGAFVLKRPSVYI